MKSSENNKKVSICVAQYNRAAQISACMESLLTQNYSNFEIVVVNDGSPDPKVTEILAKFESEKVIVINQQNTGFVGAMNAAIAAATGEYIAVQGAGDISYPTRLSKQVSELVNNPKLGLVASRYINRNVGGINDGKVHNESSEHGYVTVESIKKYNVINHGTVMFKRDLFQQTGGYRKFFKFAQDMDLWLRMLPLCQMLVMDEVLYDRGLFTADGIASDARKTIVQKGLVSFAIQCYDDKKQFGQDLVDEFGDFAGLFKAPCRHNARFLAREALEGLRNKDHQLAKRRCNMAKNEKITLYVFITMILVSLHKAAGVNKLIELVLNKLLPINKAL